MIELEGKPEPAAEVEAGADQLEDQGDREPAVDREGEEVCDCLEIRLGRCCSRS